MSVSPRKEPGRFLIMYNCVFHLSKGLLNKKRLAEAVSHAENVIDDYIEKEKTRGGNEIAKRTILFADKISSLDGWFSYAQLKIPEKYTTFKHKYYPKWQECFSEMMLSDLFSFLSHYYTPLSESDATQLLEVFPTITDPIHYTVLSLKSEEKLGQCVEILCCSSELPKEIIDLIVFQICLIK